MNIIDQLASSMGRTDQQPNKELAQEIIRTEDTGAVHQLVEIVRHPSSTDLLSDALKVLEMIGEGKPELASPAFSAAFPHLNHKSNKIRWRAMSVLSNITQFHQEATFDELERVLAVMDEGSVITRDHGFAILVTLYTNEKYREHLAPIMAEQLLAAPDNQLGQYAEKWLRVIDLSHISSLTGALESRQGDLHQTSHQKRIASVLLKLQKMKLKKQTERTGKNQSND